MPRFFITACAASEGDIITVTGEDAAHITKALRMKPGERITICDCHGTDYMCEIIGAGADGVPLRILESHRSESEPDVEVTLYQGLPKGEKMELIVQKSVELGVTRIVPVITLRSISRPDEKGATRKIERWNRIAEEAAKQSGRGILPAVMPAVSFKTAADMIKKHSLSVMLYEKNGGTLKEYLNNLKPEELDCGIGIMVGPEGGFDDSEADFAKANGIFTAGMGPRILRTETAPVAALAVIMYATGNL